MDDLLLVAEGAEQATNRYHQVPRLFLQHGLALLHAAKTTWAASGSESQSRLSSYTLMVMMQNVKLVPFAGVRYQFGVMSDTAAPSGHHVPPELLGQITSRLPAAFAVLQGYIPVIPPLQLAKAPWHFKSSTVACHCSHKSCVHAADVSSFAQNLLARTELRTWLACSLPRFEEEA